MISYFGLFVLDFIVYFVIFKLKKIYTVRQWGSKPVGAERLRVGVGVLGREPASLFPTS